MSQTSGGLSSTHDHIGMLAWSDVETWHQQRLASLRDFAGQKVAIALDDSASDQIAFRVANITLLDAVNDAQRWRHCA